MSLSLLLTIGDAKMVKECLVILNNEAVTVVKFDDKNIQFPSINKDVKKVFVNYENGKYSIVDEKYMAESVEKPKKKNSTSKKTTFDKNVDRDIEIIAENNE